MDNVILFEIIGIIAGLSVSIPSIPQIIRTIKTKNVEGLSTIMFIIRAIGGMSYLIYGRYLGSISMMVFNGISAYCSILMINLIIIIRKRATKK